MAEFSLGTAALGTEVDLGGLRKGISQAEGEGKSGFGRVGSIMSGALKAGLLGVAGGVVAAIGGIVKGVAANAQFEDFSTRFKVLLGSTEAAEARMKDLAKFGASTPFELPGVVDADLVIQGFGLHSEAAAKKFGYTGEQIRTIAGDVASGTGQDFKEMALLLGKFSAGATGEAISRFQELGITTREELTKMGLNFSKSGQLLSPLPQAMNTVLGIMKTKYGGLMQEQSMTFNGMMSNLQDWVGNTLRTVSKPIFDKLKVGLQGVLTFLGSPAVQSAIEHFATFLADGIGNTIEFISGTVDKAVPILQGLVDALIRGQEPLGDWSTFRDALSTLFGADVGNIITEVTSAIQDFLTSLQPMVAFVQANLQPILVGLAAIIADLVIPGFVAWATAAISGAAAAIVALAPVLVPVLAIGAAAALLYQAWTTNFLGIQDVTASVVAVVQSVVQAVLGQVTTFVQNHGAQIQSFFASAYQQVQAIIGTAWEIIKAIIGAALTFIQGTIVPWLAQISTFISEHTTQIQAIFDGAWMIISNLIQAYLTLIQGILSAVMAAIQGDWSGAWQIVQDTLSSVWGNIQGIVNGALQILQNALTTAWDAIKNQVSSVWNGIAGTISSIWDGIVGSIKGSINSIIDSINTLIAGFNSISGAVGGPQIGQIPHLATGTRFFAGGLALVGERGPELAMLPRGAQVLNHRDTRLALAGAGNVTFGDIIIQGDIRSRADVDYLVDQIDQRIGRKALARTRV